MKGDNSTNIMNPFFKCIILSLLIGCNNSHPTYNPFDKVFEVSTAQLMKNNCYTIVAGCGYFNLSNKMTGRLVYYQIFIEEPENIVAKGLTIPLDTIAMAEHLFTDSLIKLNLKVPIDTNYVASILSTYELTYISSFSNELTEKWIFEDSASNEYILTQDYHINPENFFLYRELNYFVQK